MTRPVVMCPEDDCDFSLAVPESVLEVRQLLTCPDHDRILVKDPSRHGHKCPDSAADRVIIAAGEACPFCGVQEGSA